ncbi:class I SAM-dependent methyltransferase [Streptomyces sp. NPDC087440]|uniref:class I SAM-dependent methyltransferase n=1 Tax=Streptomyces sp. NPDC087440 TaxID=3365790 RepID=UPI0038106485
MISLKRRAATAANRLFSRLGVLVSPRHYYSSAPDLRALEQSRAQWCAPSELPGIRVDLDAQIEWLRRACLPYATEYEGNALYRRSAASGPGYGYVEAQALHGILRSVKPRRYLEVGSGVSTRIALRALELNAEEGEGGDVVCVEPYPRPWLADDPRVTLHRSPVQSVDLDVFTSLGAGDVLFIDSSHVVGPGADTNFLVLEVLPRLAAGVIVHIHDIYLPYDYQRDLLDSPFHWAETSLVRAFLTGNDRVGILACLSHLHYDRTDDLRKVFPEYRPQSDRDGLGAGGGHFPASLWLRTA